MDPQLLLLPPPPAAGFNFDSTSTSPYATAPSSPKIFFSTTSMINPNFESSSETVNEQMDFAFDFSGQLDRPSISDADDLFDGGRIKTLEPPPPPPPRSYRKICIESKGLHDHELTLIDDQMIRNQRGRETTTTTAGHKVSRSLSPLRVSDLISEDQKVSANQTSPFGFTWYNKWNLKNLLLFRSTSEGSAATIDDRLKKYATITKGDQDVKNSSFRSDGGGSIRGSSRRMKRKMSAHEIHYTANRAVAEEMRRKTFLPYKSGLLGCLGFSHQDLRDVSRRR